MRKGYFTKEVTYKKGKTGNCSCLWPDIYDKLEDYWRKRLGKYAVNSDTFVEEFIGDDGETYIRISCDVVDDVGDNIINLIQGSDWEKQYIAGLAPRINVRLLKVVG